MKKIIILFSILLFSINVFSQYNFVTGYCSEKYLLNVKGQTLKVVLSGESSFRDAFKKAVEANWTYTKIEFITREQVEKKYKNMDEVFLFGYFQAELRAGNVLMLDVPMIGIADRYLVKGKYKCLDDLKIFFPYPASGIEIENLESYLSLSIRLLNNYMILHEQESKKYTMWNFVKYIETLNYQCKKKKILICDLDLYTEKENITAKYKFDYEIVKRSRIVEAINNKEDVLIYYAVPSVYGCYYFLVSPKDGNVYYYDSSRDDEGSYQKTQKSMFKKLAKAKQIN